MNRRHFFYQSASVMAASFVPGMVNSAGRSRKQRIHIGAQTNTFGVPIKPFGRLLEIADTLGKLGYEGFETNYVSLESEAARAADCHHEFAARHIPLIAVYSGARLYDKETTDQTIEQVSRTAGFSAAMGATYLIVGCPRLPHGDGKLDLTATHMTMEGLNRLGQIAQKEGLKLCYHNHVQEFEDDPSEMSFLLKETDPTLVWLNYDVGNPYGFGPSAASFSQEHFRRILVYHLKDVYRDAQGKLLPTDLGAGKIDLPGVVAPLL